MAEFKAHLANFLGAGVDLEKNEDGGWTRCLFHLAVPGHDITIKQKREFVTASASDYRGGFVHTSDVTVSDVNNMEDGEQIAHDLAALLSIVSQSHVSAFAFEFGDYGRRISTSGFVGRWRTPFGPEADRIADFIQQTWTNLRELREPRALKALIRLLIQCDVPNTPLEIKIAQAMICLENIKTYWALDAGRQKGIIERPNGSFEQVTGNSKTRIHFKDLVEHTLSDVGMALPPNFSTIQKLRNAILHRGLIRPTDNITTHIYGADLSEGEMFEAMHETYEDVQDLLHEYLFRLLGFKGKFHNYSTPYGRGDWTVI